MEKRTEFYFKLILVAYLILGTVYALNTPVFEASDELWHYPMIRHLADGNPLPVQVFDPALAGPWKQEASQPPLYYYLGAALTFWVDASDMEAVRWENPHVDNGVITADGNINLIVHDPALNPWQGALLAVRIVRLFSVLLGAVTVYFTYKIAQLTWPEREDVVLGATAVLAFTPMFLFISGAVNNDNLIIPLAAIVLYLLIWLIKRPTREQKLWRWQFDSEFKFLAVFSILVGIIIGAASLTKLSGIGLLPLVFGTFVIYEWQKSDRRWSFLALGRWVIRALGFFLIVVAMALAIAGWWYIRNVQLYDDWRGWTAFIAVLGQRAHPASLRQLWAERWGFMLSYWGLFGGVNVPMNLWIYHLLNGVVVTAVLGFPVAVYRLLSGEKREERRERREEVVTVLSSINDFLALIFSTVERHFGLVIALLWSGAVVYGIVDWATITWSSQGRLVFSALPSLNILMMIGLVGWLPVRYGQRVTQLLAGFIFLIALLAPFVWIRPAYQHQFESLDQITSPLDIVFGEQIQLSHYQIVGSQAIDFVPTPNDVIVLETEWDVLAETDRNWSVFVHLNDPAIGKPIAQRDMYLGQGLLATSFLEQGDKISNRYVLQIPKTAVSPAELELVIGLYDFRTDERLPTATGEFQFLERIPLHSVASTIPNATAVNFEDEIELQGFELSDRSVPAGGLVELTLYFKALRPLTADYTFFTQLVDSDTTRWGAVDLPASVPTSQWNEGETQTVQLNFEIREDAPANVYPLIIGMYTQTETGEFNRLQIITEDGRPTDDFLNLTLLR
ncbi:MAG: phospholipid carrier-dependent glycosyltransferase, partial [Chloroflexota bacterium]